MHVLKQRNSLESICNAIVAYAVGLLISLLLFANLSITRTGANITLASGIRIALILGFSVFFEELIFRKFFFYISQRFLSRRLWIYFVFSSLIFAFMHTPSRTNFFYFAAYFVAGLYFAYLYFMTLRINLPCIMHLFNNCISTLIISQEGGDISLFSCNMSSIRVFLTVCVELYLSVMFFERRIIRLKGR